MPRRSILLFATVCVVLAAGIAAATIAFVGGRDAAGLTGADQSTGQAAVGGPFQLTDQNGVTVDQSVLDGKWTVVFFGFTYCPDFCPATLATLAATKAQLGDAAEDLQVVFISVDPERDTPQALRDYLSSDGFPPGVIGLTGTPEQVSGAARSYRAFFEKSGEGEGYTMNHSLTIYLMGPDGRFRSSFAHDLGPERSAQLIRRVVARG